MGRIGLLDVEDFLKDELNRKGLQNSYSLEYLIKDILKKISNCRYDASIAIRPIKSRKDFGYTYVVEPVDGYRVKAKLITISLNLIYDNSNLKVDDISVLSYDNSVNSLDALAQRIFNESKSYNDEVQEGIDDFFRKISRFNLSKEDLAVIYNELTEMPFLPSKHLKDELKKISKNL